MTPTNFAEANSTLSGGPAVKYGTGDDVTDLPVHRGGGQIISCWKLSPLERVLALATGKVWLKVRADRTHFPVHLVAESPFLAPLGDRVMTWFRERILKAADHSCVACGEATPSPFWVCSKACAERLARRLSAN